MLALIAAFLLFGGTAAAADDAYSMMVVVPRWTPDDGLWQAPPATKVGPLSSAITNEGAIEYAGKAPDQRDVLTRIAGTPFESFADGGGLLRLAWWRSPKLPNMYFAFDTTSDDRLVGMAIWGFREEQNQVFLLDFGTGHTFGDRESELQEAGLIRRGDQTNPEGFGARWHAYSYTNYRLLFRREHPFTGEQATGDDYYLTGIEFRLR